MHSQLLVGVFMGQPLCLPTCLQEQREECVCDREMNFTACHHVNSTDYKIFSCSAVLKCLYQFKATLALMIHDFMISSVVMLPWRMWMADRISANACCFYLMVLKLNEV